MTNLFAFLFVTSIFMSAVMLILVGIMTHPYYSERTRFVCGVMVWIMLGVMWFVLLDGLGERLGWGDNDPL